MDWRLQSFENLKIATTHFPILALPNFTKPVPIETDASENV